MKVTIFRQLMMKIIKERAFTMRVDYVVGIAIPACVYCRDCAVKMYGTEVLHTDVPVTPESFEKTSPVFVTEALEADCTLVCDTCFSPLFED